MDKQKRYSKKRLDTFRSKPPLGNKASEHRECDFCSYDPCTSHKKGKCLAKGKRCNQCKKKHHFAHAKVYPVNNVSDLSEEESEESSKSSKDEIGRIETVSQISEKEKSENYVEIEINGQPVKMKVDFGCSKVLIPGKGFQRIRKTTRLVATKVKLRPYGMSRLLDVIGRARVDMKNGNRQVVTEWVYVVRGQNGSEIETLLGSAAAKRMNVLEIHPDGKSCTVNMITESEKDNEIDRIKQECDDIFHGIEKFRNQEIEFQIDPSVMPVVQKQRPIPLGLRDKIEEHLKELLENDIIEGSLDSSEPHEWVSNAMITRKKEGEQIRLNVDMRHVNLAIKPTHYAVPTVSELRHQLNGATRFTELDLRHGFQQIKLANKSRHLMTFYTHMHLFRFKRLVLGASPASQECHEKLRIALLDLQGVLQIEDDLLIYGRTQSQHNERLPAVLQILRQIGVTLRKEKCQWNQESVIWFGYKFGPEGMSPDPAKVETIKQLPPPKNTTEVKLFLQMNHYNYMFLFDNEQTYADTTAPLRAMLQKGDKFVWTKECQ